MNMKIKNFQILIFVNCNFTIGVRVRIIYNHNAKDVFQEILYPYPYPLPFHNFFLFNFEGFPKRNHWKKLV